MLLRDFDYDLPPGLIAQRPLEQRDASRLLLVDRAAGRFEDRAFCELPAILQPGDVLVFNNTKVFPARLLGRRRGVRSQPLGKNNPARRQFLTGEAELFLTRQEDENAWPKDTWQGLVRPGRKIATGEVLVFGEGELEAEVLGRGDYGLRRVRLRARDGRVDETIDRLGHVPLPPYIHRPDLPADRESYQTVFAKVRGAVAAPTAGFHFTPQTLEALRSRGVQTVEITLHVGHGTFQPVHAERVEDHRMEPERYLVSEASAEAINGALGEGRRVIAVGTTCVRTLEHLAAHAGRIVPGGGETSLFLTPGFRFQVVKALLTNFHLPRSTLLILVSAFAGRDFILSAYRHAVEQRYRFYSYGDCMLIV